MNLKNNIGAVSQHLLCFVNLEAIFFTSIRYSKLREMARLFSFNDCECPLQHVIEKKIHECSTFDTNPILRRAMDDLRSKPLYCSSKLICQVIKAFVNFLQSCLVAQVVESLNT